MCISFFPTRGWHVRCADVADPMCGAIWPVTVPADHYFMMGDNRDNSQDSRYWGFLPRDYVKGKALFVYFSVGEGGLGVRWSRILHQIH